MRVPNEEQAKVIENLDDNIILFASAGTGKTFTVANRVANIIQSGRAKPQEILCLTFTIKACGEMKEDISRYIGADAKSVVVKTIHGFCYRLLAEEYKRNGERYNDLQVCDEVDEEELLRSILSTRYYTWRGVKRVCGECGSEYADERENCVCGAALDAELPLRDFPIYGKKNALMTFVSEMKHCREENKWYSGNETADWEKTVAFLREYKPAVFEDSVSYYAKYVGKIPDEEFVAATAFAGRLVAEYDEHLRQSNQVDFDDLVVQVNGLLERKEVRARWAGKYKYIIVDEMQDTSVLEYDILKKIFDKNNVMLCGDFFQTIYEWRGSRPQEILSDYVERFGAKAYTLCENYRATKTLARAGFGYLERSYPDLIGKFCPAAMRVQSGEEGEKIFCYAFDNRQQEAKQIFKFVQRRKAKENDQICIMARTNNYIAALSREFDALNAALPENERVRFFTVEDNYQFFKKPVVKDVLAVVKLLLNGSDRVSMERLAEKYIRGVGGRTIETLRDFNRLGVAITSFIEPALYEFGDTYAPLIEAYKQGNIVVYDTETTGLDLAKDQMVQLSAIRLGKNGEIVDTLDLMIAPSVPISQGAYETHGFDLAYIRDRGGVDAKTALQKFSAFCQGCVLVGHNSLRFDAPLIKRQLQENGLQDLLTLGEYDTMTIAKQFHSKLPDFKLSTLCFYYGIVNDAAHNALGDITATAKCLVKMLSEDILPTEERRRETLARYKNKFEKFYAFTRELREMLDRGETAGLAVTVIEKMMLDKRYKSSSDRRAMREVVESLRLGEGVNAERFLREYLTEAALPSSQLNDFLKRTDCVPVITVHQAKGCEFDVVLLAGVDDNHFPSFAAKQSGGEDEEKKVFYVAITRAKSRLILTRAIYNGRNERKVSPYAACIPPEYVVANEIWKRE